MTLRRSVDTATAALDAAGVPSPRADALLLAAHVLAGDRGEVERRMILGWEPDSDFAERYAGLVAERAARIPLQHLTGRAPFRRLELHVGPGVFVPRPETEEVAGLAIAEAAGLDGPDAPLVVDLCSGSGAIALAVADEVPAARVVGVETSDLAVAWARRSVEATGVDVTLVHGDAGAGAGALPELAELAGRVDVVVSNPPYIPVGMVPTEVEVREHDPEIALYGGSADGLRIPLAVASTAAELLRPGGLLVMEHAETQGETLPAALRAAGWTDVADHPDLSGRPRAVTGRRADR